MPLGGRTGGVWWCAGGWRTPLLPTPPPRSTAVPLPPRWQFVKRARIALRCFPASAWGQEYRGALRLQRRQLCLASHGTRQTRRPRYVLRFLYGATIWFSPVMASSTSSGLARPIFRLNRSTDRVRIWLIFTQDFFGRFAASSSSVRGNPARGGWRVSPTAILF